MIIWLREKRFGERGAIVAISYKKIREKLRF